MKLAADARFCTNCGAKCAPLAGAAPAAPAEPPGQAAFVKGQQYFLGDGQEQNFEAAQKEFADAAKAGHKEAPLWVQMCLHYREIMLEHEKVYHTEDVTPAHFSNAHLVEGHSFAYIENGPYIGKQAFVLTSAIKDKR